MKKKPLIIISICAMLIGFALLGRLYSIKTFSDFRVEYIDFANIPAGVYEGTYKLQNVSVSANVTVIMENHQIIDIILNEHINHRGESANIIVDRIIDTQALEVDVVSGATQSSKVIMKAVENALLSP